MRFHRAQAFARGFWEGFCSPMFVFESPRWRIEQPSIAESLSSDWERVMELVFGKLPPRHKEVLGAESTSVATTNRIRAIVGEPSQRWDDALPSTQALEVLEQVIPGGADRVLKMVESQLAHRMDCDRLARQSSIDEAKRGQWMGIAIVALSICAGTVTAIMHCPWQVPVAFVSVTMLGVVRAFVHRRRNRRLRLR